VGSIAPDESVKITVSHSVGYPREGAMGLS
jgi:hypothetical protein